MPAVLLLALDDFTVWLAAAREARAARAKTGRGRHHLARRTIDFRRPKWAHRPKWSLR